MTKILYDVAKSFSPDPVARYEKQSPDSGEAFRNKVLKPFIDKNEPFEIDFSNVSGAGSSFLEESFGGLIRDGYTVEKIKEFLTILPKDDDIALEAWEYIEKAWENKQKNRV